MKKIFLSFAVGLFSLAASVNSIHAQDSTHAQGSKDSIMYAKNENPAPAASTAGAGNETGITAADIKTISKKATRNFTATFTKADDVKWFALSDGFIAYCTVNGTRIRTNYDKKGNWLYSIRYYGEKKLPVDVRALVKRTYYDFSITSVQEIHIEDKIVYLVYMNDETTFQTVRVCDYEMDVYQSFPKSL